MSSTRLPILADPAVARKIQYLSSASGTFGWVNVFRHVGQFAVRANTWGAVIAGLAKYPADCLIPNRAVTGVYFVITSYLASGMINLASSPVPRSSDTLASTTSPCCWCIRLRTIVRPSPVPP